MITWLPNSCALAAGLQAGLFAFAGLDLEATVGRIPKDDITHRDQLTKAVAEFHTALVTV